jgi:hypothetical protein
MTELLRLVARRSSPSICSRGISRDSAIGIEVVVPGHFTSTTQTAAPLADREIHPNRGFESIFVMAPDGLTLHVRSYGSRLRDEIPRDYGALRRTRVDPFHANRPRRAMGIGLYSAAQMSASVGKGPNYCFVPHDALCQD